MWLLLAFACAPDTDGDGNADAEDCAPDDAAVFPGAPEICNDKDDDCDGEVDEGLLVWADADGDGYAGEPPTAEACGAGPGWSAVGGDCDDHDVGRSPGVAETCDGTDENCDGVVDDGFDADGDGHLAEACARGDDCDDHDPATYSGASEVCGDGVDQDCGGEDLECGFHGDYSLAEADAVATGGKVSYPGASLASGDLDGDGQNDLVVGGAVGGLVVLPGPVSGTIDLAKGTYDFLSDGYTPGIGVADVDGDGQDDVAMTGWSYEAGLYVRLGPLSVDATLDKADVAYFGDADTECGSGLALVDLTGDGRTDAALACDGKSGTGGAVWIFGGPPAAVLGPEDAVASLHSATRNDYFGVSIWGKGDVDGDGQKDLLVAAPPLSDTRATGSVWLFSGPFDGSVDTTTALAHFTGAHVQDYLGVGQSTGTADMDGDGRDDIALSAAGAREVYAFVGPFSGERPAAAADVTLRSAAGEYLGSGLSFADIDATGRGDLAVGDTGFDAPGAVYLFSDLAPGTYDVADASATFYGEDRTGAGAATLLDDISGDGWADMTISAGAYPTSCCAVYVVNQVH